MSDMELDLQLVDATSSQVDEECARMRDEYRRRLAEKLKDPEFRKIEGFPIGTDEAIIALSDPPYFTPCPNPFVAEWLEQSAKPYVPEMDDYHREPFATDVSEGKNDPIYNAHSYHTKVPHKAIMRYILHYTEPGDVVYDGFCGTGMTGVAAQMCGDRQQVESLDYRVLADGMILDSNGDKFSRLGVRKAILNDLSPAASFIAYNYNSPVNANSFEREAQRILMEIEDECSWMYVTLHTSSGSETHALSEKILSCKSAEEIKLVYSVHNKLGRINYTVWSDVFVCPNCGEDIVFWDAAVDQNAGKVRDTFSCQACGASTTKRGSDRAFVSFYDESIQTVIRQAKQVPVLINYTYGKSRYDKVPDMHDLSLIEKIQNIQIGYWFPIDELPKGFNTEQPKRSHGFTHVHHFYTKRNLYSLALLRHKLTSSHMEGQLLCLVGDQLPRASKMHKIAVSRLNTNLSKTAGVLSGTLYVPSNQIEYTVLDMIGYRVTDVKSYLTKRDMATHHYCETVSTTASSVLPNSIDYIFTDPPFGGNLMYSELNFLWEAWLGVKTNNCCEAITNDVQHKGLPEYQKLMTLCFSKYFTVLKPGRWMTVEFHNSANAVWNAIGEALERAGFVVAGVRTIDKQQGSFKQVTSSAATKVDLVISCYKPRNEFEERFRLVQGKVEGVIEFIRQHLDMLPVVPISREGKIEVVAERTKYLLFDRMIAYHLQRGARIPMSAAEFYQMLDEQFVERDDMYFLPDQAAKYDAVRTRTEVESLELFISDERSAVHWVRQQLMKKSLTLGELTPAFMQEMHNWASHEERPELRDLLKVNFIPDEDGKWRVPDPNQEKDLEALRRKALLKTFEGYVKSKGQLKVFRKEAILEGFKHCWQTKQFGVIVAVCERIPAKILQEVPEFVQFYDIAKDLAPTETLQLEFTWEG